MKQEYEEIKSMSESGEETVFIETIYKRKQKVKATHRIKWVNEVEYYGHKVSVMELEIEKKIKNGKSLNG